jgi:hypothetical protein
MKQVYAGRRWGRVLTGITLAAGSLLCINGANAQLIADESFAYDAGFLVNVGGGFGWSTVPGQGTWSDLNPNLVRSPGLTYGAQGALGNTATTNGFNQGAYRTLANNQGSVNGTNTVYVSFLARKNPEDATAIGTGSATYAGISLFDGVSFGSVEKFFLGMPYESGNWGFDTAGNGAQFSSVPVNDTVHLFVFRFDFTATNVDVRMYIDPPVTAEPATANAQQFGLPAFNFQQIRIQSGTQDDRPEIDFDELKIAGDYATAVGVSVTGQVTDIGGDTTPQGIGLTADFRNPANNTVLFTRTATLDASGNLAFTSVPRGTYNILLRGNKVLSKAFTNVAVNNTISLGSTVLLGGDTNADNAVDITDLLALIGAYNQSAPAPGYLEAADFNGDGINDITDLLILIANYNKLGDN